MSSDVNQPTPENHDSHQPADLQPNPPAADSGAAARPAGRRILIGSQRQQADRAAGVVTADEQPAGQPAPADVSPPELTESGNAPQATDMTNSEAGASAAPSSAASSSAATPSEPTPAASADEGASAEAVHTESAAPHKPARPAPVEVPNVRGPLPPELEAELSDAMGGKSMDELIASSDSGALPFDRILEDGTRTKGRVLGVHGENVFLDLGVRDQGVVATRQFKTQPGIGDEFDVIINNFDHGSTLYDCSVPGAAVDIGDWSDLKDGVIVEARVTGHNKGGLECEVNRIRAFMPASQIATHRVENFDEWVGKTLNAVVVEVNQARRRLVVSHRGIEEREREAAKGELLRSLAPGQIHDGTVRSVQDFGAFVDLGGIDGLLHVSELSWTRVNHPKDVLQVGQKVQVKVTKVNANTGKISLSAKDLQANPWDEAVKEFEKGTRVNGKVTRVTEFGAFIEIAPGVEGLVHISELAHHRVFRVTDVLKEGQDVEVQVLNVDPEHKRIGLSYKATQPKPEPKGGKERKREEEAPAQKYEPKRPAGKLKGGLNRRSGGEGHGLKW